MLSPKLYRWARCDYQ